VHKYLGNNTIHDKDKITEMINYIKLQYRENGIGRWAIIDKATNNFMGWTGLKLVKETINNHTNYYDLGYRLLRQYWGQGIATESAIASLSYGFDILNCKEIYAAAHFENSNSNKILSKLGFNFVETFDYLNLKQNWYKMDKNDWEENQLFR
jgi:RimJ/RimL family protein N-acetyltransferase